MKTKLRNEFEHRFGIEGNPPRLFFSPGRVNLIGEHTDYNGGHVFPCALTMGTYGAARINDEGILRLYSSDLPASGVTTVPVGEYPMPVQQRTSSSSNHSGLQWTDYVVGVCDQMSKAGHPIPVGKGLDLVVAGDLPRASGLSSSASLEMLVAVVINDLFDMNIPRIDLVKYAQKAENEYVGVSCGIMDQFAIGMGQKDAAMLLDTGTLACKHVPLSLDASDAVVVIGDTNKSRALADSKYNERLGECREALMILRESASANCGQAEMAPDTVQQLCDLKHLCDLDLTTFEKMAHVIGDEVIRKRARHAVSENERTLVAVDVLEKGDLNAFGKLMVDSHRSLRDDYEVSCEELDLMVDLLLAEEGVLGARMTGAGFGGCTVSLVKRDNVQTVIEKVKKAYDSKTGRQSAFYMADVGQGTHELL